MQRETGWKDNSGEAGVDWHFVVPAHWSKQRVAEQCANVLRALTGEDDAPSGSWLALARALPPQLLAALVRELEAGNRIADISRGTWPSQGSIVVTLHERFQRVNRDASAQVKWCALNYPHSWREEMAQQADGVEHLLIV